jgi:hypothetical protein
MTDQVAVPKFVGKPEAKSTIAPILKAVLGPGPSVGRTQAYRSGAGQAIQEFPVGKRLVKNTPEQPTCAHGASKTPELEFFAFAGKLIWGNP